MKIKIADNKYLNALFVLMLGSAIAHMALLFGFAVAERDWYLLNYFRILDLDRLFPNIPGNFAGDIFSWAVMGAVYAAILKFNKND